MENKIKTFKELIVWQKSIRLVIEAYKLTDKFPKEEIYGLTSQIRRAAVAVPSNIAEGWARYHTKEFIQFIGIAYGSCAELDTQLEISKALKYISEVEYLSVLDKIVEIEKMLSGLSNKLNVSN
ncbi:MAG: four helix bundle protein [Candidatus Paceibacterota bacterium]|jgi:four helix bundle protein